MFLYEKILSLNDLSIFTNITMQLNYKLTVMETWPVLIEVLLSN